MASALKHSVGVEFVRALARRLQSRDADFEPQAFTRECVSGPAGAPGRFEDLELKARLRRISTALGHHLPGGYPEQLRAVLEVAPHFGGLAGLTFPDFVEVRGRAEPELSLSALRQLTPYSSSEFAIRPFLQDDLAGTLRTMISWSRDPDPHVRRLSSEGARPRLPWSFPLKELIRDPSPLLPILEALKSDDSLYVRKSVANSLNDISKDHPDLARRLARAWCDVDVNARWVAKHGMRTLLKRGDQRALRLFGTGAVRGVDVSAVRFSRRQFRIGTKLEFSFDLEVSARRACHLRVEYAIHYVTRTDGKSRKVFKIVEREFAPGAHSLTRSHSLRQMTTRTHFAGAHTLEILVNGVAKASGSFHLK